MNQLTTKFDATTGESNGTRLPVRSLMDSLARVLVRLGILTEDLDYHLISCIDGNYILVLWLSEMVSVRG